MAFYNSETNVKTPIITISLFFVILNSVWTSFLLQPDQDLFFRLYFIVRVVSKSLNGKWKRLSCYIYYQKCWNEKNEKKKQFSVGFGATTKSSEKGMHDDNKAFWKQLEIS